MEVAVAVPIISCRSLILIDTPTSTLEERYKTKLSRPPVFVSSSFHAPGITGYLLFLLRIPSAASQARLFSPPTSTPNSLFSTIRHNIPSPDVSRRHQIHHLQLWPRPKSPMLLDPTTTLRKPLETAREASSVPSLQSAYIRRHTCNPHYDAVLWLP